MIRLTSALMLSAVLAGCGNTVKDSHTAYGEQITPHEGLDIFVASDLHYLAPVMNDKGAAYQRYTTVSDGKNLDHIDKIMEAFRDDVMKRHLMYSSSAEILRTTETRRVILRCLQFSAR